MKLLPVSRPELIKRFRALGWHGPVPGGKHQHMVKGAIQLSIPNPHGGKEIGVHLLKIILAEAGISREQWLRL
ncbi:type II toxin-antitoxin system HicA family toxin [Brevifollis gellanilyticus]|uniref:type II toxin-antitoxin system HicA family toxin n=1 Tax=Brevifollis gellanilyticus TaxID=748831 RepID=UPI0011BE8CA4